MMEPTGRPVVVRDMGTGKRVNWALLSGLRFGLALIVLSIGYGLLPAARSIQNAPSNYVAAGDPIDAAAIYDSAVHHHSPLSFVTGPWILYPSQVYYRPTTSTLFWSECRAFGDHRLVMYFAVSAMLYALCMGAAWLFARDIGGSVIAAITIGIIAVSGTSVALLPASNGVLTYWKDQADIITALFYVGALLAFRRDKMTAAIILALLAFGAKESAYTLPAAALLLLWHDGRLSEWRQAAYLGLSLVGFLAVRAWAMHDYSHAVTYQANGFALHIWGSDYTMSVGDRVYLVALAAALLTIRRWGYAAVSGVFAVVAGFVAARHFAGCADGPFLASVAVVAFIGALIQFGVISTVLAVPRCKAQTLTALLGIVSYLPAAVAGASNTARVFLPSIMWALFVAYSAKWICEASAGIVKLCYFSARQNASPKADFIDSAVQEVGSLPGRSSRIGSY